MKLIDRVISPLDEFVGYIGSSVYEDENLMNINAAKHIIEQKIPTKLESYAIALHSFYIYNKCVSNKIKPLTCKKQLDFDITNYKKTSWKEFYKHKNIIFSLEEAFSSIVSLRKPFPFEIMTNELKPEMGKIDREHLEYFITTALSLYGDQEISVFYFKEFFYFREFFGEGKAKYYEGKISGLLNLYDDKSKSCIYPNVIYPKERNWVIGVEYNSVYSLIQGELQLIEKLVENNKNEIYSKIVFSY